MGLAKELNEFFKGKDGHGRRSYLEDFLHEYEEPAHELEVKFGPFKMVHNQREGYEFDLLKQVYLFDNRPGELVAIDGYYSSWEGTDWSSAEFYDVVESEKTIKVYTRVK